MREKQNVRRALPVALVLVVICGLAPADGASCATTACLAEEWSGGMALVAIDGAACAGVPCGAMAGSATVFFAQPPNATLCCALGLFSGYVGANVTNAKALVFQSMMNFVADATTGATVPFAGFTFPELVVEAVPLAFTLTGDELAQRPANVTVGGGSTPQAIAGSAQLGGASEVLFSVQLQGTGPGGTQPLLFLECSGGDVPGAAVTIQTSVLSGPAGGSGTSSENRYLAPLQL